MIYNLVNISLTCFFCKRVIISETNLLIIMIISSETGVMYVENGKISSVSFYLGFIFIVMKTLYVNLMVINLGDKNSFRIFKTG